MAKQDDIPKTDPSEIESLIRRLKQSNLEPHDTQLIERLLRLVLSMASLLQHKNASIKRLRRLIFGPTSDKRAATGSSTEEEAAAPGDDSEQQPGSGSSPGTVRSSSTDQKPKRPGHLHWRTGSGALSVFLYLRRMAADGEVVYSDDTRVNISRV
jgi:hypothetical protein